MHLHTPERGADETREAYAERRRQSKRAAQALQLAHVYGQRRLPGAREALRNKQRSNGFGPFATFADTIVLKAADKRTTGKHFTLVGRRYTRAQLVAGEGPNVPTSEVLGTNGDIHRRIWRAGLSTWDARL